MTIEYRRNQLAFDPLPQNTLTPTCKWAGTGNLGFTTMPGPGRYDAGNDPRSRTQPYSYPKKPSNNKATRPYFPYKNGPAANTRSRTVTPAKKRGKISPTKKSPFDPCDSPKAGDAACEPQSPGDTWLDTTRDPFGAICSIQKDASSVCVTSDGTRYVLPK